MTEKTYTVVGTATNADGTIKVRWANDLASRVKILDKAGCTDIDLVELPTGMTKLVALEYLRDNYELSETAGEVVDLKIGEKSKVSKRAATAEALTQKVETKTKEKAKTDPKVEKLVEDLKAETAAAE